MEEKQKQKATATAVLIVVNISIFFIFALIGKAEDVLFMKQYGAMYEPYVMEGHEYYRLLTSIFLHFGIEHLLSNMVMLGALGMNLEPEIGRLRFLLVYFVSGIGGNICSLLINVSFGEVVVSAGASGAVFGLTGALLCAVRLVIFRLIPYYRTLEIALMILYALPAPFIIPLFADVGGEGKYISTSLSVHTLCSVLLFAAIAAYSLA